MTAGGSRPRADALEPVLPLADAGGVPQRYISEILERNGGNRTRAARELGVDPRTIFRFLEKQEAEGHPVGPDEEPA